MNNTSTICDRAASEDARVFVVNHRMTSLLILVTVVNCMKVYVTHRAFRLSAFGKYKLPKPAEFVVQSIAGLSIFFVGYGFLIYYAATGCDYFEIYLFTFGFVAVAIDVHEWVVRWDSLIQNQEGRLLMCHHLAVFVIALAYAEYDVFTGNIDPLVVAFFANVGMMVQFMCAM